MIQKNERRSYASDLSDSQWAVIAPLFARIGNRGKWEKWELVNAVLYLVDNGCKWRNLPHDFPSIQRFCADAGYRKTFEQNVSSELGLGVDILARIKPVWEVLPKRWTVERSLAWINNSRRLSKDYEISACSAQAVCTIAAFRTLLKRF